MRLGQDAKVGVAPSAGRNVVGWNTWWVLLPVFCKNKSEQSDRPVVLVVGRKCVM